MLDGEKIYFPIVSSGDNLTFNCDRGTESIKVDGGVVQMHKGYSSLLSFTVTDINTTVTKLMALGAELDGPIKYEIHGKVAAMRCLDGHMLGLYEPV
ncbi:hypothetical protein Ahy_B01g055156 [Arachis hypogaea]|uniref:Uncharacterized protein n=1 Tax=Arachis hypogaea TaxID=3818 RepID=A0A445AVD7_ARAHY|nr:hypothetical protein Ahy_B01g055156 [Arachis hypogaea]